MYTILVIVYLERVDKVATLQMRPAALGSRLKARRAERIPPISGHNRRFLPLLARRALARHHSSKQKSLDSVSLKGACSFEGADLCSDEAKAADNACGIIKGFNEG